MSDDRAVKPHIRRVEEGTSFHAQTDRMVAIVLLVLAAASAWYLRAPLVFDPDSPDFNPFGFITAGLCLLSLKYVISAVRGTMHHRRFGQSVMEMEGESVAPGETLKGVVRAGVVLEPLGDYEVRLRCVEQTRPTSSSTSLNDYIRGEQTLRVKAQSVNPGEGIPFAFMIPTDAMSTATADVRMEGTVRWILEVKAPLKGLNFYAIFGVEVRAPSTQWRSPRDRG